MSTSLAHAAKWYADRGLHIFPCTPRSKYPSPACPHGHLDAAPDAVVWSFASSSNIGLSAIASGLVVVDLDTHDAADELPGALIATWTVLTARGAHYIYRVPENREPTYVGIKGQIDIKYRGYSLLPPSIHPSGFVYTWEASGRPDDVALADAPSWLIGEQRARREHAPSDGEANESFLGAAFAHLGMLGSPIGSGKWSVRCPWEHEHSQRGSISSTIIFAPQRGSLRVGEFHCSHSHCRGRRRNDVLAVLPVEALTVASRLYRSELDAVAHVLARLGHG